MERRRAVSFGSARRGSVWKCRYGEARVGKSGAGLVRQVWPSKERRVRATRGLVMQVGRGEFRWVQARSGGVWYGRYGVVWFVVVWWGLVRMGYARQAGLGGARWS